MSTADEQYSECSQPSVKQGGGFVRFSVSDGGFEVSCQNRWNYESSKVPSDFDPSCNIHWKTSD